MISLVPFIIILSVKGYMVTVAFKCTLEDCIITVNVVGQVKGMRE